MNIDLKADRAIIARQKFEDAHYPKKDGEYVGPKKNKYIGELANGATPTQEEREQSEIVIAEKAKAVTNFLLAELDLCDNRLISHQNDFSLTHLSSIHKELFDESYYDAGKPREYNIGKKNTFFEQYSKLEEQMNELSEQMRQFVMEKSPARKGEQDLSRRELIGTFASFYSKLNAIHPFTEGNGRSTRIFMAQFAREMGVTFDLNRITNEKPEVWNEACADAMPKKDGSAGELNQLRDIFNKAIRPHASYAFEHSKDKRETLLKFPELSNALKSMDRKQIELMSSIPNSVGIAGNKAAQKKWFDFNMEAHKTEIIRKLDTGLPIPAPLANDLRLKSALAAAHKNRSSLSISSSL